MLEIRPLLRSVFFLDHAVRGHRFTLRMQGTPDAKFMNKIIFVALLEPQWAPIYTCRGGPWGPPKNGFGVFGIRYGGLFVPIAYLIEASGANRPRKRLRLQRLSSWEASPPPNLVVPGRVSASSAGRTGKPSRPQRRRENRLLHDPRLRRSTHLDDRRWGAAPLAG